MPSRKLIILYLIFHNIEKNNKTVRKLIITICLIIITTIAFALWTRKY